METIKHVTPIIGGIYSSECTSKVSILIERKYGIYFLMHLDSKYSRSDCINDVQKLIDNNTCYFCYKNITSCNYDRNFSGYLGYVPNLMLDILQAKLHERKWYKEIEKKYRK